MSATAERTAPLLRRIGDMVEGGRLVGARTLLAAVRESTEESAEIADLEARLLIREGRNDDALSILDLAIHGFPESAQLFARRSELRLLNNDPMNAATDAAEALIRDRHNPAVKALLGVTLIDVGRYSDAAACLGEALSGDPDHPGFRRAFATALERDGDLDGALQILEEGITRLPSDSSLRTSAIMIQMRQRDFRKAIALAEQARRDGVVDACILGLLGHAQSSLGQHADAELSYREALKLGPEDPYVRHLVAASGVISGAKRAPTEYLKTVFDGYASRFELHLIGLGYRVPGLILSAIEKYSCYSDNCEISSVLDLGCGTGLVGVVLSDLNISKLTGVDISDHMLDEASKKGIYSELLQNEIENFLRLDVQDWKIITAADVFCYFGDIENVITLARNRLDLDGLFIFSLERLLDQHPNVTWQLGRQGRYAHSVEYVRNILLNSGLDIISLDTEVLRYEADSPVDGMLIVARRRCDV